MNNFYIFLSLIFFGFCTSCVSYEEVEIREIQSVKLLEFSGDGLVVESDVKIYNPNNLKLKIVDSEFNVFVKNIRIGTARIDNKITIPANSTKVHKLVLKSDQKDLMSNALPTLMALTAGSSDQIQFKVDGYIVGKASFFFKKKVDVKHEGKVPLKLF